MYRINKNKIQELYKYLDKNLAKKFICANHSHAALPILFVKKQKDGLQFCIDCQDLNAIISKNRYLLPLI